MSGFCARREMAAARQETATVRRVPRRKTGVDRAKKCKQKVTTAERSVFKNKMKSVEVPVRPCRLRYS